MQNDIFFAQEAEDGVSDTHLNAGVLKDFTKFIREDCTEKHPVSFKNMD